MDDMRREIQELQSSNETSRKSAVQRGNENAEQQIQMLRSDLMRTVSDWKEAERDRQIKEDASRRLQAELMKERDKSQLLQSQVSKLEERLLTANRELATFRGLDVYHAAKEAELATYRSSKAVSPRESVAPISKAPSVGELAFTRGRGEMSSRQLLDDWDRTPLHRPLRDDNQTAFERVSLRPTDLKGASEMDEPMSIDDISATDGAISQKKPIKIAGNGEL